MPPGSPAAAVPLAYYNTGSSSGINAGTTYSSALGSGGTSPAAVRAGVSSGNANIYVGALVGGALVVIVLMHLLGFRFAFDVDVGRRG